MSASPIIQQIRNHFDQILTRGIADFGPAPSAMWLASLDSNPDDQPPGVNFYWDQPHLVAACLLSQITGDPRYQTAAHAYATDFLARSVAHCGLLLWGNHYRYDVQTGDHVWFTDQQPPAELGAHRYSAWLHNLRPFPPAWDMLWQTDPTVTERSIRAMGEYHLFDPAAGGFSQYADQEPGDDLLESGAILTESLAWLYARTGDPELRQKALSIARYSFATGHPDTRLLPVASTTTQWHRYASTTEVGLWAGSLLRAADYTEDDAFVDMAQSAVSAYLYYGWDAEAGLYFGRLNIVDGTPQRDDFPEVKITRHQPDTHSNIWNNVSSSHDYPLALAETCVHLYERTQQPEFEMAIQRWAEIIRRHTDDKAPEAARTAGQFGRALHFLLHAGQVLPSSPYRLWAAGLADEAMDLLFADDTFTGSTAGSYDHTTGGVGLLLLALLALETGQPLDLMGFGF